MSSSFRYTLTKDRSLPSSEYRCFLSSGCFAVSASSACPTVDASTPTVACLSVYTRKGVGIWIFIAKSSLGICLDSGSELPESFAVIGFLPEASASQLAIDIARLQVPRLPSAHSRTTCSLPLFPSAETNLSAEPRLFQQP